MNCWETLGIEPTSDRRQIQQAYEQQLKFATGDDADKLLQAYREATGEAPAAVPERTTSEPGASRPAPTESRVAEPGEPLGANEGQVVREVVIQVKALLNDSRRSADAGIWEAILCEPPADKPAIRGEIARLLEPQVRPMAENGSLAAPVAQFLGQWFDWPGLEAQPEPEHFRNFPEPEDAARAEDEQSPQMVNFWPAVIGWIVALAVLAMFFSGMGGG
ncbi:J domain-containing protein [Marinobacter salinexigens]|uniref:J domain-containing protein n=1 Tax=Marinobacter salinexigens TaxID=2919747 RepID=A0A5B0VHB4_9GAMM|nr:J domain-containing protein [Marinobacter salinexigens]KAA1173972.1 J domain-containing protein [Marinobacter salinexigens]